MPKMHHLILNMILSVATPDFVGSYTDPLVKRGIQKNYVVRIITLKHISDF